MGCGSLELSRIETVSSVDMSVALSVIRTRTSGRCCEEVADVVTVVPEGVMPNSAAMDDVIVGRSVPVSMRTQPMGEKDAGKCNWGYDRTP